MIVDCHTHLWSKPQQLGVGSEALFARQPVTAGAADHQQASRCVDKTLVLGFRSRHLQADIPDELILDYVSRHSDRMIGIAAVDPTESGAVQRAERLLTQKEFRGLTISPAAQNFHPSDSRAQALYELAADRGVPIFFHQHTHFHARSRMEYARPALLDEIALEYPALTMVLTSLAHPWVDEAMALLGKHQRIFADVGGLVRRRWPAYNALVLADQFNVMDKILFGSDFPFFSAAEAIESIYRLHELTQGTNLPTVPRETLRSMVERDALSALGIARPDDVVVSPINNDEEESV